MVTQELQIARKGYKLENPEQQIVCMGLEPRRKDPHSPYSPTHTFPTSPLLLPRPPRLAPSRQSWCLIPCWELGYVVSKFSFGCAVDIGD